MADNDADGQDKEANTVLRRISLIEVMKEVWPGNEKEQD